MSLIADYLTIFFTSMLPVWELKGCIPLGVMIMGLPLWTVFWLAFLGSSTPSIFIVFFIEKIIRRLTNSKVRFFRRVARFIMSKVERHHKKIEKYGYLGIFLFVAVPLPGTGVWTGSLLAAMLGLSPKKVIPLIYAGNLVAGLAMICITLLGGEILNIELAAASAS